MTDRVLLLSANFGSGHTQAARAAAEAFRSSGSNWAEAVEIDHPLLSLVSSGYLRLLDWAPRAYRTLYHAPVGRPARLAVRAAYTALVKREIERTQPTLVLATHPFPAAAAAHLRRRGRLKAPLAVVMSDFVPHPLWVAPGVDRYCLPSDWAAEKMLALGAPSGALHVTGIPIGRGFGRAAEAGGNRTSPHVLAMGGGLGLGPLVEAVRSVAALPHPDLRVTVVCGRNETLRSEMEDLFGDDPRVTLLGFTSEIPALMARSSLLITKPGGLTCSEALAAHLPILLLRPLPGHEEENAAYLTGTGAALLESSEEQIGPLTASLLYGEPSRLARMRAAAQTLARPDAAASIAAALKGEPGLPEVGHRPVARVI